jgi:arylsulfatase A-like enzyme
MDKLSSEGIRLDRHYTGSWCVPSRASMLTGRLPHNMVDNKGHTIPEGVKMIPAMLAKAGYVSHQVGKWHLGNQKSWQLPFRRGFNSSFGYLGSVNDYYTQHQTADSWPCDGIDLWRTDRPAKDEDGVFSLPLYGNEVKRIIKTHDVSQPLFMYVALQAMHSPSPKSRYGDGFADHGLDDYMAPYSKYGDGFAVGNGLIGAADDVLGQAVAALKEKSMWKNTLLVHTSDNGASITPIGQEVRGTNFPLRGGKNTNFEGGVRVPAFITGGALPASKRGVVKQGYVHVTDWYHTFAHVAGITLSNEQQQKIDSIDMWPWLSGGASDSPRTMMVLGLKTNRKGATDALVNGKYKLIRGALLCDGWSGNDYPQYPRDYNSSVGLDCDPHLGELDGKVSTSWLFNIVDDPSEKENLIGKPEHAAAQARMEAELDKAIAKSQPGLNKDPDVYRDDNEALCNLYARRHRGYLGPFLD